MKSWKKNEVDAVSHIMSFLKVAKVKAKHTEDMRKHLKSNPGSHSKVSLWEEWCEVSFPLLH